MDLSFLKELGQVTGVGGVAVGVLLVLFRDVVRKKIFPTLTKSQGQRILILILLLTWSVAVFGLSVWAYVATHNGSVDEQTIAHVGKVLGENTQTPIKGAKVTLELGTVPKIAYTDTEGFYKFQLVERVLRDPYIKVLAEGYEPYERHLSLEGLAETQDIRLSLATNSSNLTVLQRQILLTAGKSARYQVTTWNAANNTIGLPRPHLLAAVMTLIDDGLVTSSYDYKDYTSLLQSVREAASFVNDGINRTIYSISAVTPANVQRLASFQLTPTAAGRSLVASE